MLLQLVGPVAVARCCSHTCLWEMRPVGRWGEEVRTFSQVSSWVSKTTVMWAQGPHGEDLAEVPVAGRERECGGKEEALGLWSGMCVW